LGKWANDAVLNYSGSRRTLPEHAPAINAARRPHFRASRWILAALGTKGATAFIARRRGRERAAIDQSAKVRPMLPRRRFLQQAAAGCAAVSTFSCPAHAQAYPTRPVRIIVGFAPGGSTDIVARVISQRLADHLGQPIVIENRPGAAGNVAAEAVVKSSPDGYTLLVAGANNAINATLYEKLNFNFLRDVAPVAGLIREPLIMEVNPSVPIKTVAEFIAYAKANPGKISMGSAGTGSINHLSGELFKLMTGVSMMHVPYRGGAPAVTDLLSGQVQIVFGTITTSSEHIRAGKLRALAVTTAARSAVLPDIPAIGEFVPGYEASNWNGIGAPGNTPTEIIDKLGKAINASLADSKIRERLIELGSVVLAGSPADFGRLIVNETEKWAKVVKFAGIRSD
jgi:tripartite-type tricarboxylate transporter receptor subunit TctC